MGLRTRCSIGLVLAGVLFAAGVGLLQAGIYGLTVFVLHPYALGALTCWVFRPARSSAAAWCGACAVLVASGLLLLARIEGGLCILISLQLTLPLGAFGGWHAHESLSSKAAARGGIFMLLLLPPAGFAWDTHAQPAVYRVTTSVAIAAPPEEVWSRIVNLSRLPDPSEWYFRAGLAYPTQARIARAGPGATRYCQFSTGPVVESIDIWDEPRLLRFRVLESPAPMREWTPYGEISPRHLHGYFISREGEFRLTPLPGNRTLLEGTSWYQHGLWPAQYWHWWSDAIIHRIHRRVFQQIKALAEAEAQAVTTIETVTLIRAPVDRCFDLARSVEVHLAGNVHWGEQAVAAAGVTAGLLRLGDRVTWRAKHFGFWHRLTSEISAFERPAYFQDVMVSGIFRSMRHDHYFRSVPPDHMEMRDVFAFAAPVPFLGPYMRNLLRERNAAIKRIAECEEWRRYLP